MPYNGLRGGANPVSQTIDEDIGNNSLKVRDLLGIVRADAARVGA